MSVYNSVFVRYSTMPWSKGSARKIISVRLFMVKKICSTSFVIKKSDCGSRGGAEWRGAKRQNGTTVLA